MPSVYAVVSDSKGHVILPTKVERAYFYCCGHSSDIYPQGKPLSYKKAPGKLALPGGAWEGGESLVEGARREFMEETGVDLSDDVPWEPHEFSEDYYAVYFTPAHFVDVAAETMTNLLHANTLVIEDIRDGKITTCAQIVEYGPCPLDNELCAGVGSEPEKIVYNLKNPQDWQIISALRNGKWTNWYYEILAYLKARLDSGA